MATKKDILEILGLITVAYPNFKMVQSGDVSTADAYLAFLGDLPSDLLKSAVLQTCAESGRAFAPSVGEIRGAAQDILRQVQGIPSALEAWGELMHVPTSEKTTWTSDPVEYTEDGRVIIYEKPYEWSHPLVRKVAIMLGFPRFPDWDSESYERNVFMKAYEIELQSYLKQNSRLPDVTRFIENNTSNSIKQLSEGMKR